MFRTGNVIRTKSGSLEIVTDVRGDLTSTVFVDFENASATHRQKTYQEERWCDCGDSDCEECRENKPYMNTIDGMEEATLVANTVKEWIMSSLSKNFDFR